jgi:protein-L-isoaspartate(D-aspartate) O-methyltransferase
MVTEQLVKRGIKDPRVLAAMRKVPRHLFVDEALAARAYGDYPLPIGEKQTISQPYMVALMTEALAPGPKDRILEIGTGSGYQTAILAELCSKVFSMERIRVIAEKAEKTLKDLGYSNFLIRVGDGSKGWKEEAPFEGILVTAGAPSIPKVLEQQLTDGGSLIIPVGDEFSQSLIKIVRDGDEFRHLDLTGCVFVKLIGNHGWKE